MVGKEKRRREAIEILRFKDEFIISPEWNDFYKTVSNLDRSCKASIIIKYPIIGESIEMDKKNEKFLSIGTLSGLTGVHVKSLRYYDEIGILKPAYVDPDTGYRYYTSPQISIVDAIQLCVELDIPLKNFQMFLSENRQQIQYSKLIAYGKQLANIKMREIQRRLNELEEMSAEIERAEECRGLRTPKQYEMPEKLCWAVPCNHQRIDGAFYTEVNQLYLTIKNAGLKPGYEFGLLCAWRGNHHKNFLYVELTQPQVPAGGPIVSIPGGSYLCCPVKSETIEQAPELFSPFFLLDYQKTIIQTELFTGSYDYMEPVMETRCSLPETAPIHWKDGRDIF